MRYRDGGRGGGGDGSGSEKRGWLYRGGSGTEGVERTERWGLRHRRRRERVRHPLVLPREPSEDERSERVYVEAEHVRLQQRHVEQLEVMPEDAEA